MNKVEIFRIIDNHVFDKLAFLLLSILKFNRAYRLHFARNEHTKQEEDNF